MSEQKNVHPTAELRIDEDRCRAELWDTEDGSSVQIGFIGYAVATDGDTVYWRLMHTIINDRFGRRGYARALTTLLLDDLIQRGIPFTSECTYIDQYLTRHPEYQVHVPPSGS